jgi:hypothetical protein
MRGIGLHAAAIEGGVGQNHPRDDHRRRDAEHQIDDVEQEPLPLWMHGAYRTHTNLRERTSGAIIGAPRQLS